MRVIGLSEAKEWHDSNTGMPFTPFKIEKDGGSEIVRVLIPANEIESLYIHREFHKLNPTRCAAPADSPDETACPLCAVKAPRSLRTYIPVRVRGDKKTDRVQWIEYGRDMLQTVIAMLENIPEGDLTGVDIKIQRVGSKLDTKYMWYAQMSNIRPLDDAEKKLYLEPMDMIWPVKDQDDLEKRAMEYSRATGAAPVAADDGTTPSEEIPF